MENKRIRACKRYIDLACEELQGNSLLPSYLMGLADAWRLMGIINLATCQEIRRMAATIQKQQRRVSA